mmetsp:Transcript_14765/g.32459  ORF Transcript_14765/g.32459 Transcript_14765/m.32459 type:complete len:231 (+) Transcript_14765:537-1229(+)
MDEDSAVTRARRRVELALRGARGPLLEDPSSAVGKLNELNAVHEAPYPDHADLVWAHDPACSRSVRNQRHLADLHKLLAAHAVPPEAHLGPGHLSHDLQALLVLENPAAAIVQLEVAVPLPGDDAVHDDAGACFEALASLGCRIFRRSGANAHLAQGDHYVDQLVDETRGLVRSIGASPSENLGRILAEALAELLLRISGGLMRRPGLRILSMGLPVVLHKELAGVHVSS